MTVIETHVPPGLRERDGEWWLCTSITLDGAAYEVWIPINPVDLFEQLVIKVITPGLENAARITKQKLGLRTQH